MKKEVKYIAIGLALGKYDSKPTDWNEKIIQKFEADTKEELLLIGEEKLKKSANVIFQPLGAVLDITIQTTIEVDGEEFINEKYQFDSVGTLNDLEYDLLQTKLLIK